MVGDGGMLTQARIDEELRPVEGLDWISAVRSSRNSTLVESSNLQMKLFDQRNLAEITSPVFEASASSPAATPSSPFAAPTSAKPSSLPPKPNSKNSPTVNRTASSIPSAAKTKSA